MKIFVTGATGFVGSAVVPELINAGHQVVGLARSDAAAASLAASGAQVHRGDLEDLASLQSAAAASDGVIHTGFVHDFSRFKAVCEIDRRAIEAMGCVIAGSDRLMIVTSGVAMISPGRLATEDIRPAPLSDGVPRLSVQAALAAAEQGARTSAVRLSPSVHGPGDHGFVPILIGIAREKGVSAYIGQGLNRWPGVHRLDAGCLYRLAMESGSAGACYHGVAEEGVPFKSIAEAIGRHLGIPVVSKSAEEAPAHFGWFTRFAGIDCPASSALTQERLGWHPVHPTLLADLDSGSYFKG